MKSVITYLLFVVGLAGAYYVGTQSESESDVAFCIDGGPNGLLHIESAPLALVTRLSDSATQYIEAEVSDLFKVAKKENSVVPCPEASPSSEE